MSSSLVTHFADLETRAVREGLAQLTWLVRQLGTSHKSCGFSFHFYKIDMRLGLESKIPSCPDILLLWFKNFRHVSLYKHKETFAKPIHIYVWAAL